MTPIGLVRAIAVGLAVAALLGCGGGESPPNLLILTVDTTRADRFGFAGYERGHTPNFDAFVEERAVWFANAISAVPVTFPSHTTIMTGTFPVFHGVHDNDGYYLDEEVTTLAEILRDQGFATGAVLAAFPLDSEVNLDQGFDSYDDDYQADWTADEIATRGPLSFGFLERKADRVNLAAGRWLDENWQDQFFLWVHYFDPHQPYNPPAPYDSQFAADLYDGEMAFMDENFGKLLDMLEDRGVLDNTIVVVVGDHGESLDQHGEPTHAHYIYDTTMRVPFMVAVPEALAARRQEAGAIRPGTRVESQVRTADVAPTVLDLLGLPIGEDMQGKSLVPLLQDPEQEWPQEALLENYYNKFQYGWAPMRGLRTDHFKLVEAPSPELYDLREDPDELIDLAAADPARVNELRQRLERLARSLRAEDLGRSAAAQVDEETRRKLEALGYLGGGSTATERAAPFPSPDELSTMIDPKDNSLVIKYLNFVHEMTRNRRFDDALPVIRNALALDPNNARLYVNLGRAQAALGRHEKALQSLEQAQALRPEGAEAFALAGYIHTQLGDYEAALTAMTQAVELYPQQVASLQQLAGIYLALGRDEEAISHFEAVIDLDDSNWTALGDLANAYFRADRWPDARDTLQRALELNPYSSALRYRIAVFYRDVGNPDFSRQMLEETLVLSPDHLSANLDLGEMLVAAGETESGRQYLERVVELAPQSSFGERATELLGGAAAN